MGWVPYFLSQLWVQGGIILPQHQQRWLQRTRWFQPRERYGTPNTDDEGTNETGFSKTQTQEERAVLLECLYPDEFNCWKTSPKKKEIPKVSPRDPKNVDIFEKETVLKSRKNTPKVSVEQQHMDGAKEEFLFKKPFFFWKKLNI